MFERTLFGMTLAAALGSGMMAGLFFVFSVAVMPAFGRLGAPVGIAAMQAINREIVNRWFLLVFLGTGAVSVVLTLLEFLGSEPAATARVAAALVYLAGGVAVTLALNVPLNDALDSADPAGPAGAAFWAVYLERWTRWNHVRAAACLASAALFTIALAAAR